MKKTGVSILFIVAAFASFSQSQSLVAKTQSVSSVTYAVNSMAYAPYSYTTGTISIHNDDMWSDTIKLGFNFDYFGRTFSKCILSTNGQLSFNVKKRVSPDSFEIRTALPDTIRIPGNTICAVFRDINVTSSGNIYYSSFGTAPNRYFIASWHAIPEYSCTSVACTFQVVLHETTNCIDVNVDSSATCAMWNGGYGIIGIQDSAGTVAFCPPNRNYPNAWTAAHESWRFIPTGSPCMITTGIEIYNENDPLNIYPNPGNGIYHLRKLNYKEADLSITNAIGEKVHEQLLNASNITLDLSFLAPGMYYVTVTEPDKQTIFYTKIVKQ